MYNCTLRVEVSLLQCFKAWFRYDRPDHPSHFKKFWDDLTILTQRANLVPCHLLFLLILRGWEARRNPWWHSIMFRTWCHALALSSFNQIAPIIHVVNIFVLLLFFYFSSVQTKFILNYWNKSDDFWDRLWPYQLSQLSESVSIWPLQNFHSCPDCPG